MSTRSYDSALRAEQARLTRARILDAARSLLLDGGYRAMTIAALARAADVSTQTIYNAVGAKAAVIKAVYDATLAGDDDPRPMSERPEFVAMTEAADPAAMLRAYAAFSRRIGARVGPVLAGLVANADDDVRAFAATIDGERLRGNGTMVASLSKRFGLPNGMTRQLATDIVWGLTAPELFDRFVRQRGWTLDQYERWLGDAMIAALTRGG
jgi:AcrR family transcriptional regulator